MTYIDGFVIAVPKANKQKFIDHANNADSMFIEMGRSAWSNAGAMMCPTARPPISEWQ